MIHFIQTSNYVWAIKERDGGSSTSQEDFINKNLSSIMERRGSKVKLYRELMFAEEK